jgi:hypothetical protein
MTNLYLAKFPDGAFYATGPKGEIPGGPIAYESQLMAKDVAETVGGSVSEITMTDAVKFCTENGYTLYIRYANGQTKYIPETVPIAGEHRSRELLRVEGEEREKLIDVAEQHRQRGEG